MKTTLQRWGNSQGIRIPKPLIDLIGVDIGSEVWVTVLPDGSGITIVPAQDKRPIRGRHSIEQLVAGSAPDTFDGEFDWGGSQGKEVW